MYKTRIMNQKKKYRLPRKNIHNHLMDVMSRHQITDYQITGDQILLPVSSNEYRKMVEEAMCLEQQGSSRIPVVTAKMLENPEYKKWWTNNANVCRVLTKDKWIFV